jgi:hypothetical protein
MSSPPKTVALLPPGNTPLYTDLLPSLGYSNPSTFEPGSKETASSSAVQNVNPKPILKSQKENMEVTNTKRQSAIPKPALATENKAQPKPVSTQSLIPKPANTTANSGTLTVRTVASNDSRTSSTKLNSTASSITVAPLQPSNKQPVTMPNFHDNAPIKPFLKPPQNYKHASNKIQYSNVPPVEMPKTPSPDHNNIAIKPKVLDFMSTTSTWDV